MIALVPLAIALLHTATASPIVVAANPTVTVYFTADACLPTGASGSVPSPLRCRPSSARSAVQVPQSRLRRRLYPPFSATAVVGGDASSVLSVATGVPTALSSAIGGAAAAASPVPSILAAGISSGAALDASLVSAVTCRTLVNLAANNIPVSPPFALLYSKF
ncbi:hypothetical protein B0H17DRAFT_1092495 [Mycena rosella]|uniref:Secreted protein n=1 Tax=Mycena rosella TaxID=1033263 RepID=A0AAD7CUA7_MYCRO|nr:hypothetical protein B0H17DRAFT_1092495 [Mycena rosella]